MDLTFLTGLYIPAVLAVCLCTGYCIKHIAWLNRISNEYIPSILALLGAVLACADAGTITVPVLAAGAVSGLASTGLYEAFTQLIDRPKGGGTNHEKL